jgi:hypothetical protein
MSMHKRIMVGIALVMFAVMAPARAVMAQDDRLKKIEARLSALEERTASANGSFENVKTYMPAAVAILGIALFCGLWARNSGRDFWLWFVAGLVFNLLVLIAIAVTHDEDQKAKKEAAKKAYKEALEL